MPPVSSLAVSIIAHVLYHYTRNTYKYFGKAKFACAFVSTILKRGGAHFPCTNRQRARASSAEAKDRTEIADPRRASRRALGGARPSGGLDHGTRGRDPAGVYKPERALLGADERASPFPGIVRRPRSCAA